MAAFWAIFRLDMRQIWREGSVSLVIAFVFLSLTLMPFGIGPELALLRRLAPGLIWVIVVLALMLSLDRLFQGDVDDGSFDQLRIGILPLELVILAKILAHYCGVILPLVVALPLAGILVNIDLAMMPGLMAMILAAGPALCALGAVAASVSVSVRRPGLLTALIVMPLYVPVLIFGANFSQEILMPTLATPSTPLIVLPNMGLLIMMVFSLAALILAPVAAASALRGGAH